jgi:hypothetical protein
MQTSRSNLFTPARVLAALMALTFVSACDGGAEEVGEELDEAVEDVEDAVD